MSLSQILSIYISLNILVAIGFLATKILFSFMGKVGSEVSAKVRLRFYYGALVGAIAIAAVQPLLPKSEIFAPTAKVWSAESAKSFDAQYTEPGDAGYLTFSLGSHSLSLKSHKVALVWLLAGLVLFSLGVGFLLKDLIALLRIKQSSYLYKKVGQVSIFLNDHTWVPFSYFYFGANIVLPSAMLLNFKDFRIALCHELQHHRQMDTLCIYLLWAIRVVCIANPLAHLWVLEIFELQEFACDEALIGRKKVDSQSYARCLLTVAQTAIDHRSKPVCATGLTLLIERNLLKRRIEKMFSKRNETKKAVQYTMGLVIGLMMGLTAYASTSLVQDRRVSMEEAQQLLQKAKVKSDFAMVVNDLVLKELNRYLGTPEGRDYIRKALSKMETYRPLLKRKFQQYNMPEELMAVPIVESGYDNLPQSQNKSWGAGLWMFIEPTAKNYGLRIDASVDERLNPELLTDAAMRYITANYNQFKDFQLAMLAYNIGESKVLEGINKLGSRDAWFLTRKGYQGEQYLARLMAAILIMKNPETLN